MNKFTRLISAAGSVRLMNSAMMPMEGHYATFRVNPEDFGSLIKQANQERKLFSYLGYLASVKTINGLTGIRVEMNRRLTDLEDGDVMLCMRLKYRVENPALKSQQNPSLDDYEFFLSCYKANDAAWSAADQVCGGTMGEPDVPSRDDHRIPTEGKATFRRLFQHGNQE